MSLEVLDGVIQTVRGIINPDKLQHLGAVSDLVRLPPGNRSDAALAPLRAAARTGNAVSYDEIFIMRFVNGRIVEASGVVDVLSQLRQIGALPVPPLADGQQPTASH